MRKIGIHIEKGGSGYFRKQEVSCGYCGKPVMLKPSAARRYEIHFCKKPADCKARWMSQNSGGNKNPSWSGGPAAVLCATCGKEITVTPYRLRRSKNLFCSLSCKGAWLSNNVRGEGSPLWKGGKHAAWKRAGDVEFRKYPERRIMQSAVQHMIVSACCRKEHNSSRYVGCSAGFFRNHIESLFGPGMTWENYGEWHVDHVVPLSWFPFKADPSLLFVASHWSNLQPMWGAENRAKWNRYAA